MKSIYLKELCEKMEKFESILKKICPGSDESAVFWAGQAGVIIKTPDLLLGADIYLSDDCAPGGGYRIVPPLFTPDEIKFDALFVTHFHADHFDVTSMPLLTARRHTAVYTARDCIEKNRDAGLEGRSVYLDKGKSYRISDEVTLRVLDCDHGDQTHDAVGLVFSVPGGSVYLTGDTAFRRDIAKTAADASPAVMFVPINGDYGNMNESEAAEFASVVKPLLTVPCHYGTLATNHGNGETFRREAGEAGVCAAVLCPGEGILLSGGRASLI